MLFRRPLLLNQLSSEVGGALARLTGLEGFARALLVSVLPLVALEAFGSKNVVALVYFASAIFTLFVTLNIANAGGDDHGLFHMARRLLIADPGPCFSHPFGGALLGGLPCIGRHAIHGRHCHKLSPPPALSKQIFP
jgi:hypothetical protein